LLFSPSSSSHPVPHPIGAVCRIGGITSMQAKRRHTHANTLAASRRAWMPTNPNALAASRRAWTPYQRQRPCAVPESLDPDQCQRPRGVPEGLQDHSPGRKSWVTSLKSLRSPGGAARTIPETTNASLHYQSENTTETRLSDQCQRPCAVP
jgi:hypothetical protein